MVDHAHPHCIWIQTHVRGNPMLFAERVILLVMTYVPDVVMWLPDIVVT
jgi:hypothetical protein